MATVTIPDIPKDLLWISAAAIFFLLGAICAMYLGVFSYVIPAIVLLTYAFAVRQKRKKMEGM